MNARAQQGHDAGLRLIVSYKAGKAALEVGFGLSLLWLGSAGVARHVRTLALSLQHHATAAWSIALADKLVHAATGRHLLVVACASLLDGVFSAFEGWALQRRYRFSRWLVVVSTSFLVPFEVAALARHFSTLRLFLLALNGWILVYLVRRELAARKET